MIGILTEKPSAAKNFANALGGYSGTFNNEQYVIVSSHGHLYGFDDDTSKQVGKELQNRYVKWNLNYLPWDETQIKWKYKQLDSKDKTAENIAQKLSACDEVCIATDDDPSGEGELLAWEIIWMRKINVPKYTRMYFADEAPSSIQKAFIERKVLGTNIRCMIADPDYRQALFRSKWDYLSMQWTRAATIINNQYGQVLRNGRLKSAMVVVVGNQLKAVSEYVKKPFYQNRFKDENGVVYINKEEKTYDSPESVPRIYHKSAVVVDDRKLKETAPPKFLDLASLSAVLAAQGIASKTVLDTYQQMYTDGIVSYPRTEDHYITKEQFDQLLPLTNSIAAVIGVDPSLLTHKSMRKTHIKSGMAHGANRPGLTVPQSLSWLDQKYGTAASKIYELLARNYLATLCENYRYQQEKGHLQDYPVFKGTANVPKAFGWKQIYHEESADEETDAKGLGTIAEPFIYEGANPKPAAPTMKWLMKQLEKYNIGTGATRTSTYAEMSSKDAKKHPLFIDKKGKITLTETGQSNYQLLIGTHIGDLKMTENVMDQMKDVAEGKSNGSDYLHEIQSLLHDDIKTMQKNSSNLDHPAAAQENCPYVCPKCQKPLRKYSWGYGCTGYKNGCDFSIGFKSPFGAALTEKDIADLFAKGRTSHKLNFKSKKGKKYQSYLVMNEKTNFHAVPDFVGK